MDDTMKHTLNDARRIANDNLAELNKYLDDKNITKDPRTHQELMDAHTKTIQRLKNLDDIHDRYSDRNNDRTSYRNNDKYTHYNDDTMRAIDNITNILNKILPYGDDDNRMDTETEMRKSARVRGHKRSLPSARSYNYSDERRFADAYARGLADAKYTNDRYSDRNNDRTSNRNDDRNNTYVPVMTRGDDYNDDRYNRYNTNRTTSDDRNYKYNTNRTTSDDRNDRMDRNTEITRR